MARSHILTTMISALHARLHAVVCWLKGHDVKWRTGSESLVEDDVRFADTCPGDIVCETCNLVIWCRWYDPWRR